MKLDHPCKQTCSGWAQGYERGRESADVDEQAFLEEHNENVRLHTQLEEVIDLLDKINGAFYCRTSKKEWLALMEQTKPMIQKVRAKYFQYAKQDDLVCPVCRSRPCEGPAHNNQEVKSE